MLEAFLKSINCVIIMGLLAGAGYWTASKGWYDQTATQLIARLVTFLSLPCYLFASVSERLTHDELISLAGPMVIPFISMWFVFFTSRLVVRMGHVTNTHVHRAAGLDRALRRGSRHPDAPLFLREHDLLLDNGELS